MSIDDLQRELQLAKQRAARREGSIHEQVAAYEAVSECQRALAAAQGLDYAVKIDMGCLPEAAVSGPVLLQSDYHVFLTFNAVQIASDHRREDAGTAVVEIQRCYVTKFGYPNDEALPGHPLYQRGLSAYGAFEVRNSRWIRVLTERNRVRFPETGDSRQTHFIITFHDSSFECIADGLKVTLTNKPYPEVFASIAQRVLAK